MWKAKNLGSGVTIRFLLLTLAEVTLLVLE